MSLENENVVHDIEDKNEDGHDTDFEDGTYHEGR